MFDEQPDDDPSGEYRREIHRLINRCNRLMRHRDEAEARYHALFREYHEACVGAAGSALVDPVQRENERLRAALTKVIKALCTDAEQKSIVGDGVVYHLDGQTMGHAINTARAALQPVASQEPQA